jgi:crotonobetainyl-CoA:carnitine CoA-transferase CaiB-like acyl-CoA transferase
VLPSSFAVATAAQAAIAAAALAATEIGRQRNGLLQGASVDMCGAAAECSAWFSIDGRVPDAWDKISGLYRCADGWVRVHANFVHHRDGALQLLGLPPGPDTARAEVQAMLAQRAALAVEEAAARAGLVIAALRSFDEWDAHPQAHALAKQPLIAFQRIGDAPPLPLPPLPLEAPPLAGVRVLELTRILAGPVGGRTLAAHGADVMLVNSPRLPNIEHIIDTSRGKLSCHADLSTAGGREALAALVRGAHVFVQGYRPGGLAALGFGPEHTAALRPGIVHVSLSAYGPSGPWRQRRGFDSLVQTATGFNDAEMRAAGSDVPKPLPAQILDYATGFLIAFAAQAALMRQQREGGSWHVQLSLARTAAWLRSLGRIEGGFEACAPAVEDHAETLASGWGELRAVRHAGQLQHTPTCWPRPSVPPGTHAPRWPD